MTNINDDSDEPLDDEEVSDESFEEFVDLRPNVTSLNQFIAAGYREWWALAEFVDNSITSFEQNRKNLRDLYGADYRLEVDLVLDAQAELISISDNAAGIARRDMQRAFTAGTPPLDADLTSLSRFGLGMKAAGIWFADTIDVTTHALGEDAVKRVVIDLPTINRTQENLVKPTYFDDSRRRVGTTVVLRNLRKAIPVANRKGGTFDVICEYLTSIYRGFLQSGEVVMTVTSIRKNGLVEERTLDFPKIEILVAPPAEDPAGEAIEWKKDVEFELQIGDSKGLVRGWGGLRAQGSYQNTGLVLVWRGKVLKGASAGKDVKEGNDPPYKPYKIFKAQNSAISLRLVAEIDVSDFEPTGRKDDLTWTTDEEDEFLTLLALELDKAPLKLINQAKKFRSAENEKTVIDAWKDAVDSTGQSINEIAVTLEGFDPSAIQEEGLDRADLFDGALEDAVEYSYKGDKNTSAISIQIGFANLDGENRTFLLQEFEDEPDRPVLVVINRGSDFSKNFLDPRLINPTPVVRIIASMALAELYLDRHAGISRIGSLRRMFNKIIDSPAMVSKPEEV